MYWYAYDVMKEALPDMGKTLIRLIAVALLLTLLAFLAPSATPLAIGEEAMPVYTPVVLEMQDAEPIDYLERTPYEPAKENYLPDKGGYVDPSISVRVETMRAYDTTIQLTWVQIAHASQLRAELCKPYPSKAVARADTLAKRVDAILAINDDWFMHRKEGFIVRNGKELRANYSELYDCLIIDDKGDMHIIPQPTEEKISAFEGNIIHALAFGPGLVVDGELRSDFTAEGPGILKECTPHKETQRIALCQMDSLSYLIVATEGPENKGSTGLTMTEFAQLCYDLGARQAFNLDGGSSSSVILNNKKINSLSTGKIRSIGGILYFVTAVPGEGSEK